MIGDDKEEQPAVPFEKATYNLHPSFGARARQNCQFRQQSHSLIISTAFKKLPFQISEEGWGEFDYTVTLTDVTGKEHNVNQDLHFQSPRYENKHQITFKNPKGPLVEKLRASGPIPPSLDNLADTSTPNGVKKRPGGTEDSAKRRKKIDKSIDMDRLADNLQKLGEDDLLQVVQQLHDSKNDEIYMKNDVEQGEFHVDLYTLPDNLIKWLNDFANERLGL
ncbi:MAG: hypothetical protein Q9160_006865 [Pyrenula sp. 1 TL-2023]